MGKPHYKGLARATAAPRVIRLRAMAVPWLCLDCDRLLKTYPDARRCKFAGHRIIPGAENIRAFENAARSLVAISKAAPR